MLEGQSGEDAEQSWNQEDAEQDWSNANFELGGELDWEEQAEQAVNAEEQLSTILDTDAHQKHCNLDVLEKKTEVAKLSSCRSCRGPSMAF